MAEKQQHRYQAWDGLSREDVAALSYVLHNVRGASPSSYTVYKPQEPEASEV